MPIAPASCRARAQRPRFGRAVRDPVAPSEIRSRQAVLLGSTLAQPPSPSTGSNILRDAVTPRTAYANQRGPVDRLLREPALEHPLQSSPL